MTFGPTACRSSRNPSKKNGPDFIGFQEAYAANGSSQQSDLAAAFAGTKWTILRWDNLNSNNKLATLEKRIA